MLILVYQKKGASKLARPKQGQCGNCHGSNAKCKYLTTGRKCRKGQNNKKQLEKESLYDGVIGDYFTDYKNELDAQLILYELKRLQPKDLKYFSFYRYLKLQDNALSQYFYRNYDLDNFTCEEYSKIRKLKGI